MSASSVSKMIKKEFNVHITPRTIQRKVKNGNIGTLPIRRGLKGNIPKRHYRNLLVAFKSFVTISQLNGGMHECRHKPLAMKFSKVIKTKDWTQVQQKDYLQCVLKDSAINLDATKSTNAQDRRIRWTTYRNLSLWFDNWEDELVEQGFPDCNLITNKISSLQPNQLKRILNFDEACLLLNGSTSKRGGRAKVILFDPSFPVVGKATSKSLLSTMMITSSSAAGDPIPPYLQFMMKSMSVNSCFHYNIAKYMLQIRAAFGFKEERLFPVTFGQNEKGGMDSNEFKKYVLGSIIPLYPTARDKPGYRVMLKVDSGPGRMNLNLLARLQELGFVIYPGAPNTTCCKDSMLQC
jgi:hypothetical protein